MSVSSREWPPSRWDDYWTRTEIPSEVRLAQTKWVDRIINFVGITGLRLYSVADFGCGPALTLFELARRFPKVNFSGFDFSSAVIQRNNDRVRDLVLHNLTFERSTLPNVPSELSFSLVLCIATLHYVKKSLLAIQNLLGTLKPGGFLIFNYPNRYSVYWYRRNADEEMKGRFALLLSGKNVLSKRVAEKALARSCDNFWTLMGENINRANPCVFVSKKA